MYINLFCVWALTGLWHGASLNFLLWGLYFFALLVLEKAFLLRVLKRVPRAIAHVYALIFILLGWLIFVCDGEMLTLSEGGRYLTQMMGVGTPFATKDALFELQRNLPFLAIMAVGATPIPARMLSRLWQRRQGAYTALCNTLAIIGFVISNAYIASSTYNPFLYFKF